MSKAVNPAMSLWSCLICSAWILGALLLNGCNSSGMIENLDGASGEVLRQKVYFDVTELKVTEGSAAYVSIQSTEKFATDTVISLQASGDTSAIETLPSSVTIAAGKLSVPLKIQVVDDAIYRGPISVRLTLSSPEANLVAEPNSLDIRITDNDLPKASFTIASQNVSESVGTVTVIASLEAAASSAVTIPLILSGTATLGAGADFTISPAAITIAAGQTTSVPTITINNDALVEGTETIVISMGTPTNASLGAITTHTITIADDDLGVFAISGVTGTSDGVSDAFLIDGTEPTINWGASAGATSYDVTVYANDGVTVACPTQNSVGTSYIFSGCALTLGTTYKAQVIAKASGLSTTASNGPFSFYVNQPPVAGSDGPIRIMQGSGTVTYSPLTTDSNKGLVGDSDPDAGDTISITAITQGTAGGTVTNPTGTTITYTPASAGFTGVDTFTYTITDSRGSTAVATVTMHVMGTYTWTGKTSSSWANNGNWCGTITNNACVGTTGYPNSSATSTHVAIFDGTCTASGHSCNASIGAATQAYAIYLKTGYTGTLTQAAGAGNTISIGAGGYSQAAGTFSGGTASVTITGGTYSQSGGTSTWGTSSLYLDMTQGVSTTAMNVGASATMSFQSGGTFKMSGKGACGGVYYTLDLNATQAFENVIFDGNNTGCGSSRFLLGGGDTMIINGSLTHNTGIAMNNAYIKLYGNLVLNGAGADGGVVEMLGGADATYSFSGGGTAAKIRVNKAAGFKVLPAGGTTSLTALALDVSSGEFDFPSGTLDLKSGAAFATLLKIASGASVVIPTNSTTSLGLAGQCGGYSYSVDLDSTLTFENLNIYGYNNGCNYGNLSLGAGDTMNVAKTLTLNSNGGNSGGLWFNIYAQGNIVSNGAFTNATSGAVVLNGSGVQNITQGASGVFPHMIINKGAGVVTNLLTSINVSVPDADFTLQSGTLNLNGFALTVSDSVSNNNILTFSAGSVVNLGGTGTYTGEQVFTAGSTINP